MGFERNCLSRENRLNSTRGSTPSTVDQSHDPVNKFPLLPASILNIAFSCPDLVNSKSSFCTLISLFVIIMSSCFYLNITLSCAKLASRSSFFTLISIFRFVIIMSSSKDSIFHSCIYYSYTIYILSSIQDLSISFNLKSRGIHYICGRQLLQDLCLLCQARYRREMMLWFESNAPYIALCKLES